jgi:hypothetical protein
MGDARKPLVFDGPSFVRLLEVQLGLYRQLHALADEQRKLVLREDSEGLLRVLGTRRKLVNELMRINRQLSRLHAEWETVKGAMTMGERTRTETLLKAVQEELSWILSADRADCETLSLRRSVITEGMSALQSARDAAAAYGPVAVGLPGGSRFVDQMDEG